MSFLIVATFPKAVAMAHKRASSTTTADDVDDEDTHSEASTSSSAAAPVSNIMENFDRKQRAREEVNLGIVKFNMKPSAGIAYLAR